MPRNPREEMVEEFSDWYIAMVFELANELSPFQPWYEVDLSPDERVERWRVTRPQVFPWLDAIAPFIGKTADALLSSKDALAQVFYGPIDTLVPLQILDDPAGDTLRLMVQAMGPEDVARELPELERMYQRRIEQSRQFYAAANSPAAAIQAVSLA